MHILSWLAINGTAAIVEFPGVLYRSGAEAKIRKYLIDNNFVDAVIQLPPDLFFGTTIATCILVLKKSKKSNDVLFIDASAEFVRSGNKNKLTDANRERILDAFTSREDIDHFAQVVSNSMIGERDYLISVSSYVEAEDTRVATDITALNAEIARIVTRQSELRTAIDAIVADKNASHGRVVPRITESGSRSSKECGLPHSRGGRLESGAPVVARWRRLALVGCSGGLGGGTTQQVARSGE